MYTLMRSTLLIIAVSINARADIVQQPTRKDFDTFLQSSDRVFVSFTSHAAKQFEAFNEIFTSVAKESPTLAINVDCDQELGLCAEHDINAYPTIRLYEKDERDGVSGMTRYRGQRTKRAMRSFLRKRELPTLSHVQKANFSDFKNIDDAVVVAYLPSGQDKLLGIFQSVATDYHEDFVFGYATDTSLAEAESVPVPSIVCYKNTDGDNKILNGYFAEEDLVSLLESAAKDVIKDFSEKSVDDFMLRDKLTVYIFASGEESPIDVRHELTSLAKKYEKYVIFAMVDLAKNLELAENFGIKDLNSETSKETVPIVIVHAPMNDNIFRYRQGRAVEAAAVETMLTTILHGQATDGQVFGDDPQASHDTVGGYMHSEL